MSQLPLIQVTDVVKEYKVKHRQIFALHGVSLTVKPGERMAIMGLSGSGKSTLMHLIGGLDRPTAGSISVAGTSLADMNDKQLSTFRNQQVGFIFQDFNLINYLNVLDNTALPLRINGLAASQSQPQAISLLDKLGLADLADRYPHQLSGGQKQRVAVARALITKPAIILADEPTANLDDRNSAIVMDLIRHIELDQKRALIIVTHNHAIAEQFDRIVYLSDGKVSDRKNILG